MPSDRAYQYSEIDMGLVMKNPAEFIIPENLEACRLLWSKNIFTRMCNNYDNEFSWITINTLSPENQKIFDDMARLDDRFGSTWGGIGFKIPIVPGKGNDTFEKFKELIDLFPMQDVQKDGCMDIETFMMYYTDCYSIVMNPEHLDLVKPMMVNGDDILLYSREFYKYLLQQGIRPTIRVFDPSKMTKSYEEYVAESKLSGLYDPENGMVYYNLAYYQAHLRYKEQCKASKKLD